MYVSCQQNCMKLTLDNSVVVPELCTTQEEADTRIFLLTPTPTVIVAVFILGLSFFNEITDL